MHFIDPRKRQRVDLKESKEVQTVDRLDVKHSDPVKN